MPSPALHPAPLPLWQAAADQDSPQETLTHSPGSASVRSLGLGAHKDLFGAL